MSNLDRIRVAELNLYQEIPDESLRESLRQYSENIRNLQTQIDELSLRIEILESSQNA